MLIPDLDFDDLFVLGECELLLEVMLMFSFGNILLVEVKAVFGEFDQVLR